MKTMTVEDGYVLTAADYPTTYGVTWQQYTSPITSDVTVNGTYSWGGYGAVEEAETTGEVPAEAAAESTAVSRTGSTTLVKTVTETYDYVYNGGRLSQVKKTTSTTTSSGTTNATDTLNFTYDANGTPMAVKYNGTMYYFVTNVQGDVTAILNTSGTAVASYTYDAWGNILTTGGSMASTLGTLNPLRYRGYVYDTETGLYYLQSRYYNPQTGRFVNVDKFVTTGQGLLGNNMFAYCMNSPVICIDSSGSMCVMQDYSLGGAPIIIDTAKKQYIGMINGQAKLAYADEHFGLGTYGKTGCAAIAVYNSMQLIDNPQSLGSIANEFLWGYGTIAFGAGGIGPWSIGSYYRAHRIPYIGSWYMPKITDGISEGDVVVFTIVNNCRNFLDGFHTMAARYTGGQYVVYNVTDENTNSQSYSTLNEVFNGGAWVYGYRINFEN